MYAIVHILALPEHLNPITLMIVHKILYYVGSKRIMYYKIMFFVFVNFRGFNQKNAIASNGKFVFCVYRLRCIVR